MTAASERSSTSSTGERPGISIVVPAYNEEDSLAAVLDELHGALADTGLEFEILVVDDGSSDATSEIARDCSARLVRLPENRGYGSALKIGIRHARYDLICITDADGTYPSKAIATLVDRLLSEGFDMVVGARVGENVAIPWVRRPAKWALARLARLLSGIVIPDLNSGLRIFRRGIVTSFYRLLSNQFSFTTTLTLAMETNGYRVAYVPIDYRPRVGRSKIRPVADTLHFLQLILRITLYFSPLKIFLPLSGLLVLLAVAWGAYTHFVWGRLADVSTLVMAMAALQVGVVGLLAELINQRLPNAYQSER